MPDALDLLKTRRSLKPFDMTGPGPSPAEVETILTIGARVPDHGKIVPWRFIVFEGDGLKRAGEIIAKVFRAKNPAATDDQIDAERKRFLQAPLIIAVVSRTAQHPKVPAWEQELSAGASAMNIVLAANALGYAANWLTGWVAFDRDVLDAFALKPEEKIAGYIYIGKAGRINEDRPRPALSEIVTRF
ncbi:nitroreductase [soil metagenome]